MSSEYLAAHGQRWVYRQDAGRLADGRSAVINLDDRGGKGTHWTAARLIGDTLVYADQFGTMLGGYPPEELEGIGAKRVVNRVAFQRPETRLCGYYALLFAKALDGMSEPPSDSRALSTALWRSIGP